MEEQKEAMREATILEGAPKPGNGNRSLLLVVNTIVTALIFPMFGWVARELWTKVDANGTSLIRVEERQAAVISKLPQMQADIRDLSRKFDDSSERLHEADLKTLERLENLERAVLELKYNGKNGVKP